MDPKAATRVAEQLVQEWRLTELPIDPVQIALEREIIVRTMPASRQTGGVSGALISAHGGFAILYATHIDNEGFQRYSIGHELGHFFLEGHTDAVIRNGIHQSMAGSASDDRFEKEADHFASGLLMPRQLFDPALCKAGEGLEAIKTLRDLCFTSTTATAIRFAQRTPDIAAIVVSSGATIKYAFLSDALKEYPGVQWIKKNTPLPNSLTKQFNSSRLNVSASREDEAPVDFAEWFGASLEGTLYEEVIGLGRYGRTLTVLTVSDIPDPEDLEADEELEESWTPRF